MGNLRTLQILEQVLGKSKHNSHTGEVGFHCPICKHHKRKFNIHIETEKNLASLLAWSDVVVGCETYAMVLAIRVCKRVISSLPMNAHNCRLPFKKIERLNQ